MKTYLFNPYTGKPRHPPDIASDPAGLLIAEPGEPLVAASPPPQSAQLIEPEGDTLEDNVRYLLSRCPFTVRDLSGERTGMRGREDLAGTLAITFLKMEDLAKKAGSGLMEGKDAVREHRELMLLAAADLESWMKSHGKDLATVDTVKRLRAAALSQGQQTEQGSRNG